MHELSIALEMLDIAGRAIGGPKPVRSVRAVVGTLSGVCADSLRFCFSAVARQEGFGAAVLEVELRSATAVCRACGGGHVVEDFTEGCPACGSLHRDIKTGYECEVVSITLEDDDDGECGRGEGNSAGEVARDGAE